MIMNRVIWILFVMLSLCSSCTRNDGDIGELFGMWRVSAISIDGEDMPDYTGSMYFSFQSSVFSMTYINEETHNRTATYASWRYQGDDLIIDFCEPKFPPIGMSGMLSGQNLVRVGEICGGKLEMSYENPDGKKYVYSLEKW